MLSHNKLVSEVGEIADLQSLRRQLGHDLLTPEDLEPVGFWEAMGERGVTGYIPFAGGIGEAWHITDIYLMAERVREGTATEEDEHDLMDWYLNQQIKTERGTTWGGSVGEIMSQLPAFAGEFVLTGGSFTAGRKVGVKVARKFIGEAVEKVSKKSAKGIPPKCCGKGHDP